MQLTLGPVLYYWPKARLDAFHEALAAAPVDRVYLGEAVCSRRHEYRTADWLDANEDLESIRAVTFLGGDVAITPAVRTSVSALLH